MLIDLHFIRYEIKFEVYYYLVDVWPGKAKACLKRVCGAGGSSQARYSASVQIKAASSSCCHFAAHFEIAGNN